MRADAGDASASTSRVEAGAQRFRVLLRARKPGHDGAPAGLPHQAFGLEGFAREAPPSREPVARPAPVQAADPRLLVGQGGVGREARIEFRAGALAGATVHLVSGAAGLEVRLAAPSDLARQTLAGVIDRARLHLWSRGIVVRPGASVDIGSRQRQRDGRESR